MYIIYIYICIQDRQADAPPAVSGRYAQGIRGPFQDYTTQWVSRYWYSNINGFKMYQLILFRFLPNQKPWFHFASSFGIKPDRAITTFYLLINIGRMFIALFWQTQLQVLSFLCECRKTLRLWQRCGRLKSFYQRGDSLLILTRLTSITCTCIRETWNMMGKRHFPRSVNFCMCPM